MTNSPRQQTHLGSNRVEHVPDAFAHFKQELTDALCFIRMPLQVREHKVQQAVEVWDLNEKIKLFTQKKIITDKKLPNMSCSKEENLTFLIKKEKLSAANLRMWSFLCASSVLYKLWNGKHILLI